MSRCAALRSRAESRSGEERLLLHASAANTPCSRGVHSRPVGAGHAMITGGGTAPLLAQHSWALSAHAHTHTHTPHRRGVVAGRAAATQGRGWASAHACLPTPTRCLCLGWQSSQRSRRRHQWVSRSWGSSASSSSSCSSRSTTSSWACHKFCGFLLLSVYCWRPAPAPIDYNDV